MQQKVKDIYERILGQWNELDNAGKIRIVTVIVAIFITLGITVYLTTRPRMVALYNGLDYGTAGEIQTALTSAGIASEISMNGTEVWVDERNVVDAQVYLVSNQVPSGGSFTFADAMQYAGMGSTEVVKNAALLKASEADLALKIQEFQGVQKASVSINQGETDLFFIDTSNPASASVQLTLSQNIDANQAEAIARFVVSAVEGLAMDRVEIIDQYANMLYSGIGNSSDSYSDLESAQAAKKRDLENAIRNILMPQYDDAKIVSTLVYNYDELEERNVTYTSPVTDSATGLVQHENRAEQYAEGGSTGAEPGVGTNTQTEPNYLLGNTGSTQEASSETSDVSYLHNQVEQYRVVAPGDFVPTNSSLTVTAYRYRQYDEKHMTENGLLPEGQTWNEFKDTTVAQLITVEPEMIAALQTGTQISNLTVIGYEIPMFVDMETTPVEVEQIILFAILAILILLLAYGLIKKTQPDEIIEIEPELSVEDILASTQLEEEHDAEIEKQLEELSLNRESETKMQIEKFVDEKPDAVAQLLRNWLNEDWGD